MDIEEVSKIRGQFTSGHWPHFLESIKIDGLRGLTGQTIKFTFPIVAIVGENGTGKSTFLKAAASAYINKDPKNRFFPSDFFRKTHWDDVSDVTLEYSAKVGDQTKQYAIRKPTVRWSYPDDLSQRDVFLFEISRTLPLDATAGYARVARLAAAEVSSVKLEDAYIKQLSYILSREYNDARFATSDVDKHKLVGVLTRDFGEISQFHQGAGEDATLDFMRSVQNIPNYSLLIIDEIEASLHPKAQRRIVRFLLWLCRLKRIQIILSTHSPYILEELPGEARVLLLPGNKTTNVVYGASPEFALSRIDENPHPELQVFVEDKEAAVLFREILASTIEGSELLGRLQISPVGPANVVQLLGGLAARKLLPYKAVAVLDGDKDVSPGCSQLPGDNAPERFVFGELKAANWPDLPARFGIGAGSLLAYLDDAILSPDHHKWTEIIGDKIIKSKTNVWEILVNQWVKSCLKPDAAKKITAEIQAALAG